MRRIGVIVIAAAAITAAALGWRVGSRRTTANTVLKQAAYVDAAQCQACHAAIHRGYQHVGMARSFTAVSNASPTEDFERNNSFFHAKSGRHYQVERRDGRVFQRRHAVDSRGAEVNVFEQEATYAVGSGNHARTYLHRSES